MIRRSLIYLIYIIITLAFPTTLFAQDVDGKTRVHGKIIDSSTKKAIPYVSVRIKNSSSGSSSDDNGNFSFLSRIKEDTLIVSSLGYEEKMIAIDYGTEMPLVIKLKPADYDLPEVVIKPKKER